MKSSTFYKDLSQDIVSNVRFMKDYECILKYNLIKEESETSFEICKRLLESASILACSNEELHKRLAFRIAGAIMENEMSNEILRAASELVFFRIGNFPILQMSIFDCKYKDFFGI